MNSSKSGTVTSPVEVTNIDAHGVWVLISGREFFLPYDDFPWFKKASVAAILNVELHHGIHLYWPELDVDLTVDSLNNPGKYPLVAEN